MNNKDFSKRLEKRTKNFALSIINLSTKLPYSPEGKVIRNQITKSGTSIGANYREANRSRSKADFYHKIKISESEASETIYWLEILERIVRNNPPPQNLLKESNELLALFTAIIAKLRQKSK